MAAPASAKIDCHQPNPPANTLSTAGIRFMDTAQLIARAGMGPTVGSLFSMRAAFCRDRTAIADERRALSYTQLNARVNQLANALVAAGVSVGDRVAILSENRSEYAELQLACAKSGAIAACQNWRQSDAELTHCINLVSPALFFCSPRHLQALQRLGIDLPRTIVLGDEYETLLQQSSAQEPGAGVTPEDGLLILYTSGTTGFPKGALISHRALVARAALMYADWRLDPNDGFVAWSPQFHLSGADLSLSTLLQGGKVTVLDGFNPEKLVDALVEEQVSWLVMVPGMIERTIAELHKRNVKPKGIRAVGSMADLFPPQQIAELTTLLGAPFLNSLGATETGMAPASKSLIPIGHAPANVDKEQSSFCEVRLVGEDGNEVPVGEVGEFALRSATLFSGYWDAEKTNLEDFRNGWFHMGDMGRRNADGTLSFVDRRKYLIKSGGENIYPAEIERVLLSSERVEEVSVVRQSDLQWGEVPVAFVVRRDPSLTADDIITLCRGKIAGYKLPKAVHFLDAAEIPRSETGKIKRHELEKRLKPQG
jgi:fatty-acyl-CoA synthase